MNDIIRQMFEKEGITLCAVLDAADCTLRLARLLEQKELTFRSAILFAVPYFGGWPENLSAYAAPRDYHLYMRQLQERLCPVLEEQYSPHRFVGFSDHSPIDERAAAVKAGLGVFGRNGLILTKPYSSLVFLGEILSDAPAELLGLDPVQPFSGCLNCGACLAACPTGILRGEGEVCLSELTQRKGELTPEEQTAIRQSGCAWGCDLCQKVCPYTRTAEQAGTLYSAIPFFQEERIEKLDRATVESMGKQTFVARAFAWRGKKTILRNLQILEETSE